MGCVDPIAVNAFYLLPHSIASFFNASLKYNTRDNYLNSWCKHVALTSFNTYPQLDWTEALKRILYVRVYFSVAYMTIILLENMKEYEKRKITSRLYEVKSQRNCHSLIRKWIQIMQSSSFPFCSPNCGQVAGSFMTPIVKTIFFGPKMLLLA